MVVFFGGLKFKYRRLPVGQVGLKSAVIVDFPTIERLTDLQQRLRLSPNEDMAYRLRPHLRTYDRFDIDDARLDESRIVAGREAKPPFGYEVSCERILDLASRDATSEVDFMLDDGSDLYGDPLMGEP